MRINRIKRLLCSVMTVFIMLSVIPNVLASEAQSAKSLDNKEVESESIGLLRSLGIIENEELNSLLSTIKNQGEEIESLQKELDKLKKKAAKK